MKNNYQIAQELINRLMPTLEWRGLSEVQQKAVAVAILMALEKTPDA
jgi:hypothetical protein